MNKPISRLIQLALVLMLVLSMAVPAAARAVPQMDRKGSITITMRWGEEAVAGGSISLYRVAQVQEQDGNYRFAFTGDFTDCGLSLADLQSPQLPGSLHSYAASAQLEPWKTADLGSDGTLRFSQLPVGLYLVAQEVPAPGYGPAAPFLVSLPYLSDGQYLYDLTAVPKTELTSEPKATAPQPDEPLDALLPQTGMLWWPVPLLVWGGLLLLALGTVLERRKTKEEP